MTPYCARTECMRLYLSPSSLSFISLPPIPLRAQISRPYLSPVSLSVVIYWSTFWRGKMVLHSPISFPYPPPFFREKKVLHNSTTPLSHISFPDSSHASKSLPDWPLSLSHTHTHYRTHPTPPTLLPSPR
jgi:hypothetical protein